MSVTPTNPHSSGGELILPAPGEVIGDKFELVRELGRGTFGVVYEARQLDLGRRVAVKLLQPTMVEKEGIVERFTREARLASSLTNPHAVAIFDYGTHVGPHQARGLPYIAMEFLEGQDLQHFTARRRRLPVEQGVAVVLQALTGLAQAHRLGIIHRDVKPENIFLTRRPDGHYHVKMLDFGIAKAISGNWGHRTMAGVTMVGHVVGTPSFMAPEQARGEPDLKPAVDTYAMACVAYDILAGQPPYDGRTPMEIALNHITMPTPLLPGLEDSPLGEVIYQAMAKEPSERFQDASSFAAALREAAERAGVIPEMPRWTTQEGAALSAATDDEHPTLLQDAALLQAGPSRGPVQDASEMPTRIFHGVEDDAPGHDTSPDMRQATAMVSAPLASPPRAGVSAPHARPRVAPPAAPAPGRAAGESGSRWLLIATILAGLVFLLVGLVIVLVLVARGSGGGEGGGVERGGAQITVDTVPSGAQVFIDGASGCSPTPCDVALPSGEAFELEVRKSGFTTWRKRYASAPPSIPEIRLDALPTHKDKR